MVRRRVVKDILILSLHVLQLVFPLLNFRFVKNAGKPRQAISVRKCNLNVEREEHPDTGMKGKEERKEHYEDRYWDCGGISYHSCLRFWPGLT